MLNKIRVHEVAKDLNLSSKDIIEMMATFGVLIKNHMTTLEEPELDIIFEYYSQKNQVESLEKLWESVAEEHSKAVTLQNDEALKAQQEADIANPISEEKKIEKVVRYVDTRASVVEVDHIHSEKIEQMLPQNIDDVSKGKQKIKKTVTQPVKGRLPYKKQDVVNKFERPVYKPKPQIIEILIPDEISVGELAERLKKSAVEVIKKLMVLGVLANVSQVVDFATASLVAEDFGAIVTKEIILTAEDILLTEQEDEPETLVPRSPIVVVMGHVDHGKTSLLDAIRSANVISTEAGGITQHIGAYQVAVNDRNLTFLDTPGHEAFTAMRARGAQVTDIAIIVVAADDGIMPQTIEAISHAKEAGVSIIVAINKMDKDGANPDKIMQQLTEYELVPEEWGGDTICVPISAKSGMGIETLLEMVVLVADMKELRANPNRKAKGTVIEAKLDKGRGPVATVLVQKGTLRIGEIVICGTTVGRVRAMVSDKGEKIREAGPSTPVEIVGLAEVAQGGDLFYAVDDEKRAREVVELRKQRIKDDIQKAHQVVTLDSLFEHIKEGEIKDLNIIIKADVQGSVQAIRQSLEKLSNAEVKVRVIHGGVGAIRESDVMFASASNAIIIGFNVRPDRGATDSAHRQSVDIRLYRVIYDAIEEVEAAMKGLLAPKYRENVIGHAEIRQTFKVSGIGTIAGTYVTDGKISRNCEVRIVRDGIVIHEGHLNSLKRFKDDAKDVAAGYECGMGFERYNDIKEKDIVECFIMEEIAR